jgi:hypothetical protein
MPETEEQKSSTDAAFVAPVDDEPASSTADAAKDIAPPIADPAKPAPARKGGLMGTVAGGFLAAALGFGLAQVVPQGWPIGGNSAALEAELAAQAKTIAALQDQIAGLPAPSAAPDLSPLTEAVSDMTARVAALEAAPAATGDLTAVNTAIASLQADLAALKTAGPVPAATAALAAEAEARLKEAEEQATAMKAEAAALTKAAIARAALGRLQAAMDAGAPFADHLSDLGVEVPALLAENAATGFPSLNSLRAAFPEAARAALDASLRANMGDSWSERATNFVLSQTGARSLEPKEGTDADAVLSRAEAALGKGDIEAALTEVSTLQEPAKTAMAAWQAQAELRLNGDKAVQALSAQISD